MDNKEIKKREKKSRRFFIGSLSNTIHSKSKKSAWTG
jgi:hypothetical protein